MGTILQMSIGIFGLTLLLTAFILGNFWGRGQQVLYYQIMNFVGGFTLAWYAFELRNWVFTILEGIWGAFAFANFIIALMTSAKRKKVRGGTPYLS